MEKEILDQAVRLFADRGVAGTTLQDLADALGISRPALYYYVKSKDALLERLVANLSLRDAQALETIRRKRTLDPAEKIYAMARQVAGNAAANPDQSRILNFNRHQLPKGVAKEEMAAERSISRSFQTVIEEGVKSGHFRAVDTRTAGFAIIGMCVWTAWWINPASGPPVDDLADQIADQAVASLLALDRQEERTNAVAVLRSMREDLDHLARLIDD
jgi:AcrR family transcriptional regulator